MEYQAIILGGVKWYISPNREIQPLCPKHHLRLSLAYNSLYHCELKCADCTDIYRFPRKFDEQKQYILDKLDSKLFKNLKFINLDDEVLPIAEVKLGSKDKSDYFVTGLLVKSKVGLRLIVYAGKKGSSDKSQIFVEPEIRRLAFDQNNLHPSDVFTKVEATFNDGTKQIIVGPDRDTSSKKPKKF